MPELSRFWGMVIYMLFMDTKQHNKPHVHVYYGEYEAAIGSAFEPLKDEEVLKNMSVFHGVITWMDGKIDIAPETVYQESYPFDSLKSAM